MDEIEHHIATYRSAPFDGQGEAWGKTAALEALEEFLPDDRVVDFFLTVIADPTEYDMARLHLLKLLEVAPALVARQQIGQCVATTLQNEEDWTVRCWLARAVAAYMDVSVARAVAVAVVLDQDEDEDVRHNCLAGLRTSDPEVVSALRQLATQDGMLGHAAQEQLANLRDVDANTPADGET